MTDVFDEEISLRRLQVALRREDWRMFELGLDRLDQEIQLGSPFSRHLAWQDFLRLANGHSELPDGLKDHLRDALNRLLAIETRVGPAAILTEDTLTSVLVGSIALVMGWPDAATENVRMAAFRRWLAEAPAGASFASRRLLERWIVEDGATLATLSHRANLTLAAGASGLGLSDPPWVDTFFAGLSVVLGQGLIPPLTGLVEATQDLGTVSLLVIEPALAWERYYGERGATFVRDGDATATPRDWRLVKLAGSLDWFCCQHCQAVARAPGGGLQPLSVACPACGAPAWPLVVPPDSAHFAPPALRDTWAWGGRLLTDAGTVVLVDPPVPSAGLFTRWLGRQLRPGQRVLVVGGEPETLKAWQAFLAQLGAGTVVTSRGPADEVLGFLLQGGVPELQASDEPEPSNFLPPRKKTKR